jgi:hypothetical protein
MRVPDTTTFAPSTGSPLSTFTTLPRTGTVASCARSPLAAPTPASSAAATQAERALDPPMVCPGFIGG